MPAWLSFFLAALCALAVFALVLSLTLPLVVMALLRAGLRGGMRRLLANRYTSNVFGSLSVLRRMDAQFFVETMLRAAQGKALARPMGTPLHLSPWERLLFQPVYVRPRLPVPAERHIESGVTIGPRAQRPLRVEIPLLLAGMSYGGALSVEAKVALARGANAAGTATNSGESYLQEERDAAERLILQHHRGQWANGTLRRPELLHRGDAIEVQFGQGAQAAAAMFTPPALIDARMRRIYGLREGERAELSTRFAGADGPEGVVRLLRDLKQRFPVPVGVKIGATDYLEQDLDVFLEADIDFITVDGAEGGTHGGPASLQDDVGLPTMHAVARADRHLRARGRREACSLLAAGQLRTPGMCLKAMAIGADAVYLGTAAMIAVVTGQAEKLLPGEPPFQLFLEGAPRRYRGRLNVAQAANHVANLLQSTVAEMHYVAQALGRGALAEVGRDDLVALDRDVAEICAVRLAWREPGAAHGRPEPALGPQAPDAGPAELVH